MEVTAASTHRLSSLSSMLMRFFIRSTTYGCNLKFNPDKSLASRPTNCGKIGVVGTLRNRRYALKHTCSVAIGKPVDSCVDRNRLIKPLFCKGKGTILVRVQLRNPLKSHLHGQSHVVVGRLLVLALARRYVFLFKCLPQLGRSGNVRVDVCVCHQTPAWLTESAQRST